MIDLQTETVVSLSEAAALLPRRRAGKRPHVATLYRWASRGCRGVVLETIQVGGTLCTSREAVQRFCDRLSTPRVAQPEVAGPVRMGALNAARELDREGI